MPQTAPRLAAGAVFALAFLSGGGGAAVVSAAELQIQDIVVSSTEEGPARPAGISFQAGEVVFARFRIAGFQVKGEEEKRMDVAWRLEITDPLGAPLEPAKTGRVATAVEPEDKEWRPKGRHEFMVPMAPLAGRYTIRLQAEDKIAGKTAATEVEFRVESPLAALPDKLTITRFAFARSEDDPRTLVPGDQAVFAPGAEVWTRFSFAGYKFGPSNRHQVGFGFSLKEAGGKTLFAEPKAAEDKGEGSYPTYYLSAGFNLKLDRNIAPGSYVIVLTMRDEVGQQTEAAEFRFEVRSP